MSNLHTPPPHEIHQRVIDAACTAATAATVDLLSEPNFDEIDTAKALDQLQDWIRRNPAGRSVWVIDRLNGKWRVGLSCDGERFSASQDAELRGAIRNAIMIAKFAGYV